MTIKERWQSSDSPPSVMIMWGDFIEIGPLLKTGFCNHVITDAPYNIGKPQLIVDTRQKESRTVGSDFGYFDSTAPKPHEWFPHALRCISDGGLLATFYGAKTMGELLAAATPSSAEVLQDFHWIKANAPPPMRSIGFGWAVETGYTFRRCGTRHKPNKAAGFSPNWFVSPLCGGDERLGHPTQKPIAVMDWLIRYLTHEGQTVFDPFMGTATTGISCYRAGRRFVGIEKEEKHYRQAKERLIAELNRSGEIQIDGGVLTSRQKNLF